MTIPIGGVSGAGRKASEDYSFCEVDEDLRAYRLGKHQHVPEIAQLLGFPVSFTPHLLPVRRGLIATCNVRSTGPDLRALLEQAYAASEVVTVLRGNGYNVLEAQNGGEAFLLCEQFPATIHLLLTDVVMPTVGGLELAERIRQRLPDVKVLYMSGYSAEAVRRRGIEADESGLLHKPFTSEALARAVRKALDQVPSDRGLAPA